MSTPDDKTIKSLDFKQLIDKDVRLNKDDTFINFLKPTRIVLNKDLLKYLLTNNGIRVKTENGITVQIENGLSLEERVRLANEFMIYITDLVGDEYEVVMTRKELIELLQAFNEIDPEGKLEITFGDVNNDFEAVEVILVEKGGDRYIKIMG